MEIVNTRVIINVVWEVTEEGFVGYTGGRSFTKEEWAELTDEDLLKLQTDEYEAWKLQLPQG